VVNIRIVVFWLMTTCSDVIGCQGFEDAILLLS